MQTAPLLRRVVRLGLLLTVALVTIGQILRPGLNQDVRYVIGVVHTAAAAGIPWTEVWAHRPMAARGIVAALAAVSPGDVWVQEAAFRAWCVLLAAGAAVLLWRGLSRWSRPRVARWTAVAAGAALAWAPGWDFAEPEWFAAVLAVASTGLALWVPTAAMTAASGEPASTQKVTAQRPDSVPTRRRSRLAPSLSVFLCGTPGKQSPPATRDWSALVAGFLLGCVVLLKFTTAATALAALVVILVIDRTRALRTALVTVVATIALFMLTVLIEPREWQWLRDMPALNPGATAEALPKVLEGLTNSAIVSPASLVGLVAAGWLLSRGGRERLVGWAALAVFALLTVPFLVQQQTFLYHLAALPVAAAAVGGAVAAHAPRLPLALPVTGVLGLLVGVGLFAIGPRTRSANWWVGAAAVALVLAIGVGMVAFDHASAGLGRQQAGPDKDGTRLGRERPNPVVTVLIAITCLAPLLVTVSPRTTYSFSLAHNRTTPANNLDQTLTADRWDAVGAVLPKDAPVVYLSFSAPYWLGNPTPCHYVSPTFLQRARGPQAESIAETASYADNLECLSDPSVTAVVIESGWFNLDQARPDIRAALRTNFDCDEATEVEGLVICPRR